MSISNQLLASLEEIELRLVQTRIAAGIGRKKNQTDFLLSQVDAIAKDARDAMLLARQSNAGAGRKEEE